ncbi:MAG: hypothetical protein AB3N14_08060 [Flavobacteriaceae bacterium]
MKYSLFIVCLSALLFSCKSEDKNTVYSIIYKNDKEGKVLGGSKEALIGYIRGGAEIKIGWGAKGKSHSIEHLSEPIWLAVLDEAEVIAHLDPQILSKTDWDNLSANYADSTLLNQEWRVVITTKGEFDAVWYDRTTGKLIKRRPQNHTITWFARGDYNNQPLFLDQKEQD